MKIIERISDETVIEMFHTVSISFNTTAVENYFFHIKIRCDFQTQASLLAKPSKSNKAERRPVKQDFCTSFDMRARALYIHFA